MSSTPNMKKARKPLRIRKQRLKDLPRTDCVCGASNYEIEKEFGCWSCGKPFDMKNPTTPLPEECVKDFEKEFVTIMPRKNKDSLMLLGAGWDNWLRFFLLQSYEQGKREERKKMIEEIREFSDKLNTYNISSDAIDDDNKMLKSLITDGFNLIDALQEGKEEGEA